MTKQSSVLSVISKVTVNFSLLCSALALTLAVINTLVLPPTIIVIATVIALIFTLIYATYELLTSVKIAFQDRGAASGICTSAFLGAFLLGLGALILAIATRQSVILSLLATFIIAASLGCLWFFMNSDFAQVKEAPESLDREWDTVPPVLPPFPVSGTKPSVYSPEPYSPKVDREKLPPLFKDDPLYQMPNPRRTRLFYVAKEREDACVISAGETRFVLSDGASASSLPRPWATLLGQQWTKRPFGQTDINSLANWLEEPRNQWEQWVKETWWPAVNARNSLTGDYPVQPEEVAQILERGAYATLLGVLVDHQSQRWHALAIGDSCLFVVRPSSSQPITTSLPMEKSTDFSNRPPLLSSRRDVNLDSLLPYVRYKEESYQQGDILLMATDALAQWLLVQKELGQLAWEELLTMSDQQSFARFVDRQRWEGTMEEDDTTLVVITL